MPTYDSTQLCVASHAQAMVLVSPARDERSTALRSEAETTSEAENTHPLDLGELQSVPELIIVCRVCELAIPTAGGRSRTISSVTKIKC